MDHKLIQQREEQGFERGLMTSNLGSVYDIPSSLLDNETVDGSTKASTKILSTTDKAFR